MRVIIPNHTALTANEPNFLNGFLWLENNIKILKYSFIVIYSFGEKNKYLCFYVFFFCFDRRLRVMYWILVMFLYEIFNLPKIHGRRKGEALHSKKS